MLLSTLYTYVRNISNMINITDSKLTCCFSAEIFQRNTTFVRLGKNVSLQVNKNYKDKTCFFLTRLKNTNDQIYTRLLLIDFQRDGSSSYIYRKWEDLRIVPVCASSSFQSTTCQSSKYHLEVFNASWILNTQLVRFVFSSGLLS